MIHGTGAMVVDRRTTSGSLLGIERALHAIDGVAHRMHSPSSPFDGLWGNCALDRPAGMSCPANAAGDQEA
jgi:hypothetical protein